MTVFEPRLTDPGSNPDQANELVRSLTQVTTPPLMEEPSSNVTSLPGGYIDAEGRLHREARIREINGADEEAMARELRAPTMNVPRLVDLILRRTVESIGTIDPITPAALAGLLIGDRAALLLAVRILTFGNDWEVPDFPCRLCGQNFGTIVELDSIPIKVLENPMRQEFDVELRHGRVATVTMMTGDIQLEMVGDGDRTIPEENTIAIDRCLKRIDGNPVGGPVAQKMSMADRHRIIRALGENQPGPQMEEVGVQCSKCGQEADYAVSLVDLFR